MVHSLAAKYRCSQVMISVDNRVLTFTEQGQLLNQLRNPQPAQVLSALVSPDDDPPQGFPLVIGMGSTRGSRLPTRRTQSRFAAFYVDEVTAIELSQNGQLVMTAAGKRVLLWQTVSGERLRNLHEHAARVRTIALSHAAGDSVAVSGADDGSVAVFGTTTGELMQNLRGTHRIDSICRVFS